MNFFKSKDPQIRIVNSKSGKRVLDFSDFIQDKQAAKEYAKKFEKTAPNRIEFMDRVWIWEDIYIPIRKKQGWEVVEGGRNSDDRFKIEWRVGAEYISASQDEWNGYIVETVRKTRKNK